MKQIIVTAIMVFSFLTGFTQQMSPSDREEYDDLRKRAKSAKVTGIIFVASGGGVAVAGLWCMLFGAAMNAETDEYGDPVSPNSGDDLITTGAIMTGVGATAALTSIPFFLKGGRLSDEAREIKLSVKSNSIHMPVNGMRSVKVPQLQLSFTIPLGG